MSFDDIESSRSLGTPDMLFKFVSGNNVYAYTDAESPIVFEAQEYTPTAIDYDAVSSSGSLDKTAMSIRMPHDIAVAELFRVFPPSDVVGVTIFQGHSNDPAGEFLAVYGGRVLSGSYEDSLVTLRCEPVSTSMRRPGLRMRYQYGCPHALYGPACGLNREDFSFTHTVVEVANGRITLADGWEGSRAAEKFANGIMSWENEGRTEIRLIRSASSSTNRILYNGLGEGLAVGTSVTITLGCNHQLTDCGALFSNENNFGGFPWIPKTSPIGFVNQFF